MQNATKDAHLVPNGISVRVGRNYSNEASAIRALLPEFWGEIISWDQLIDAGPIKALSQRLNTVLTKKKLDKDKELGRIRLIFLFFVNGLSNGPNSKDDLKEALLVMEQKQKFAPRVDELSKKISQVAAVFKISSESLAEMMTLLDKIRSTKKEYMTRFSYIRAAIDFMRLHDHYLSKAETESLDALEDSFKELKEDKAPTE